MPLFLAASRNQAGARQANSRYDRGLVKGVARAPEIDENDMSIMWDTNVTGLINMTQAILPIFQKRPDGGHGDIINIGSIAGTIFTPCYTLFPLLRMRLLTKFHTAGREPYPGGSIYCAAKAAVRSFTESLRKELIATQIRVMEVDPGQVETVWQRSLTELPFRPQRPRALSDTVRRSSLSYDFMATKPKRTPYTRKSPFLIINVFSATLADAQKF